MENPIKMDDLGVPLFLETPRYPKKCDGHAGAEPFGTRGEVWANSWRLLKRQRKLRIQGASVQQAADKWVVGFYQIFHDFSALKRALFLPGGGGGGGGGGGKRRPQQILLLNF